MNAVPDRVRILVVDDEHAQMQALCETLGAQGYEVSGFTDPAEALRSLAQRPADLLLADLMMPGLDGIGLLREALAIDPTMAGIIMTGEGTISSAVEAMRSGALDYILKPFKLSAVLPVLARGLEMRRLRLTNASLERSLREHAAELEAANKELEAFTRSASHDLRAPLNGVLGFASLLLGHGSAGLSAEQQGWLRNIERSARHMNQLLEDLMRLSRLGRQSLELRRVDVAALVARVIEDLRRASETGRRVEIQASPLPVVVADEGLLGQVFVNLISNAVKFSREAEHPRVDVGVAGGDDGMAFFVRDNGIGFDMAQADKLFDAFHRLPGSGHYEGSGVGLSIVQRVVERHGGRIWAESSPGQGAVFRFTLGQR